MRIAMMCGIPSGKDSQVSCLLFRKSEILKSFEMNVNQLIWKFWTVSLLRIRKKFDNGSAQDLVCNSLLLPLSSVNKVFTVFYVYISALHLFMR